MNTGFNTYKKILDLFEIVEVIWVTQIANKLWLSRVIVHKNIKKLLEDNKIEKVWFWAHTRYKSLIFKWEIQENYSDMIVDYRTKKLVDNIFYKFDSDWKLLEWFEWFKCWVNERNFDFEKSIENYTKIYKYIDDKEDSCWLLNATSIFNKKFEKNYMNKVYYAWEYSFMEFWRSKLAEMTFYAKQSQNRQLINKSIDEIFYKLECFLSKNKDIDAIAIIPWSIDRKNQLLWLLKNRCDIFNLPFINLIKYYEWDISIPQKSIKSKLWRIKNAQNTIFVYDDDIKKYKKVFLIDDFVWSWSTLNITAQKLLESWINEVIWFSFVWSMDLSYEIINEI